MDIILKRHKIIPVQCPKFPRASKSYISRQSPHEGGKFVSPTHRPPLSHGKYFWYLFLLEGENIMSMKHSNDTIGNRKHDLASRSLVLQFIAPPLAPIVDIVHSPRLVQTTRRTCQKNVLLNVHCQQSSKIFINVFCDADAPSLCHK
jgi:hypothetical protein